MSHPAESLRHFRLTSAKSRADNYRHISSKSRRYLFSRCTKPQRDLHLTLPIHVVTFVSSHQAAPKLRHDYRLLSSKWRRHFFPLVAQPAPLFSSHPLKSRLSLSCHRTHFRLTTPSRATKLSSHLLK
jgi:hypothetical protein